MSKRWKKREAKGKRSQTFADDEAVVAREQEGKIRGGEDVLGVGVGVLDDAGK